MLRELYNLDQYSKIRIGEKEYQIVGYAEFKQGKGFWKKFKIIDFRADIYWLHIYECEDKDFAKIYAEINPLPGEPLSTIYESKYFELVDEGISQVIKISKIHDLEIWDTVYFRDYESTKNPGEFLSYERWNDNLNFEYGKGNFINKKNIKFLSSKISKRLLSELTSSIDIFFELALGKTIIIDDIAYCIYGISHNQKKDSKWREYKLVSFFYTRWLSVEKVDDKYVVSLSKRVNIPLNSVYQTQITTHKRIFELIHTSLCEVNMTQGQGSYKESAFIFYEFQSFDGEQILQIKQWNKKRSYVLGKYIHVSDIIISDKAVRNIPPETSVPVRVLLATIFIVVVLIFYNQTYLYPKTMRYTLENSSYNSLEDELKSNSDLFARGYIFNSTIGFNTLYDDLLNKSNKRLTLKMLDITNSKKEFGVVVTKNEVCILVQESDDIIKAYISSYKFLKENHIKDYDFNEIKNRILQELE